MRLNAWQKIGEAAMARDVVVKLAQLLVAPMIAALGDKLASRIQLFPRLHSEPGRRGGAGQNGWRRARRD
jgi:hypothetical protein